MEYDYVIVGGGSAGSVLAARLSENPKVSVCLLEAGGAGRDFVIRAPAMVATMVSGRPKINNWALQTEPQPGLNGRRGYQPRGKALGGSSAINAMLYVRGHPKDYDEWAELGCEGWDWDSVLPYFKRSERNARGADELHSDQGPLSVTDQSEPRPIARAFIDAAEQVQQGSLGGDEKRCDGDTRLPVQPPCGAPVRRICLCHVPLRVRITASAATRAHLRPDGERASGGRVGR